MRSQNFGIEIEMTGLTRAAAARIIAGYFDTQATHVGGGYDAYTIRDSRNRQWKVVSDASILCRNGNNRSASRDYSVEFVSPICHIKEQSLIQKQPSKSEGCFCIYARKAHNIRLSGLFLFSGDLVD